MDNKSALTAVLKRLGINHNSIALAKFLIGNARGTRHYFWLTNKTLPFKAKRLQLSELVTILEEGGLVIRAGNVGAERWKLYPTTKLMKYSSTDDRLDRVKEEVAALKADMIAVKEAIAEIQANDPPVTQGKIDKMLALRVVK